MYVYCNYVCVISNKMCLNLTKKMVKCHRRDLFEVTEKVKKKAKIRNQYNTTPDIGHHM